MQPWAQTTATQGQHQPAPPYGATWQPQQQQQQQQQQGSGSAPPSFSQAQQLPSYAAGMRDGAATGQTTRPLPAPLPRYGTSFSGSAPSLASATGATSTPNSMMRGASFTPPQQPRFGLPGSTRPQPQQPPQQPQPQPPARQPWTPTMPPNSAPSHMQPPSTQLTSTQPTMVPPSLVPPGSAHSAVSSAGAFGAPTRPGLSVQPPFQPQQSFSAVPAIAPPSQPAVSPPSSDKRPGYERSWTELSVEQQAACRVLGYDRSRWDDERSELAASRIMAAERDTEEQLRAQEAADTAAAAAVTGRTSSAAATLARESSARIPNNQGDSAASAATKDAPVPFKVKVVNTELDADTVFYVMDVERPDASGDAQRVRKRYSEFEVLRKELAAHSKGAKAVEFPKKQRMKGKRGGRDEKTVDSRSSELETWLNNVITTCVIDNPGGESSSGASGWRWQIAIEDWLASESKGADDARASTASAGEQEQEDADLMAAIQASLGDAGGNGRSGTRPAAQEGVPPQSGSTSGLTSLTALASVDNLPATIEAIEMGFAPERVKRLQSQRQQSTGAPYKDTQALLEALMSAPE